MSVGWADIHRHLEGSIRPRTAWELCRQRGLPAGELPYAELERLVTLRAPPYSVERFMAIWTPLRLLCAAGPEVTRIAREAVEDAFDEGLSHVELRTSVVYFCLGGGTAGAALDRLLEGIAAGRRGRAIGVRLVAMFRRHADPEQNRVLYELLRSTAVEHFAGIDVGGDESRYGLEPLLPWLHELMAAGLPLTLHAGEWGPAGNVRQAIQHGACRIGHGIRAIDDPRLLELLAKREVVLEVAPTSNVKTGAVACLEAHPLAQLVAAGVRVALVTDDPAVFETTIAREVEAARALGIGAPSLEEMRRNGLAAAF